MCISRLVPKQASSPCGAQRSVAGLKLQLGTQTLQCLAYVRGELVRSHLESPGLAPGFKASSYLEMLAC